MVLVLVLRMGSVACKVCGYVRWAPETPCPACGSDPGEVLHDPSNALAIGFEKSDTPPVIEAAFRVESSPPTQTKNRLFARESRGRLAEAIVIVGIVGILFFVASDQSFLNLLGIGEQSGVQEQVIEQAASSLTFPNSGQIRMNFTTGQPGTLEGSYRSWPQQVQVFICIHCFQNDSQTIYSNAVAQAGSLHVVLAASGIYGLVLVASGCAQSVSSDCTGPTTLTWNTDLKVVY